MFANAKTAVMPCTKSYSGESIKIWIVATQNPLNLNSDGKTVSQMGH